MADVVESIQWMCGLCRYVYDPDVGDPKNGIPPGTPFEELPDDWVCPVCKARQEKFFDV
jgi:rubredoxin